MSSMSFRVRAKSLYWKDEEQASCHTVGTTVTHVTPSPALAENVVEYVAVPEKRRHTSYELASCHGILVPSCSLANAFTDGA